VAIWRDIGRKASGYKGNGMIMNTVGRRESLGSGKYHLMFRKESLEVMHTGGVFVAWMAWSWAMTPE
jgi:hypothetical protein